MPDPQQPKSRPSIPVPPLLLWGIYAFCIGIVMYLIGILMVIPRYLLGLYDLLTPVSEWLVWYSGMPIVFGLGLVLIDLLLLLNQKRHDTRPMNNPIPAKGVVVALTAYNDELSIHDAVEDFKSHPKVDDVIVVSNNSTDNTIAEAEKAGAIVYNETLQGYGACVYRCLSEALKICDGRLIILCEGDRTFRAHDIDKLLAYAPHADIVNGTRTVEALRERHTQLSTFMFYGNLFVGKLLESKHLGSSTITDVGTTYKLCHPDKLAELMPHLNPEVNLVFNAYFLDQAMAQGLTVVEVPITFYQRVGESKGGNIDNLNALNVGLGMMKGITFGWPDKNRDAA